MSNEFSIVPVIRVATTGRAKCQVSKEKIEAGEQRVGYTVHKQGVPGHQIMKWIKPSAFASNCITVIYGAAKAKCAYDKTTVLERGQPRLKIALKNCQGEDKEKLVAAKRQGERVVRNSGLGYTVIRPGTLLEEPAVVSA